MQTGVDSLIHSTGADHSSNGDLKDAVGWGRLVMGVTMVTLKGTC